MPGSRVFDNITVTDKDTIGANIEVECLNTSQYPNACDIFAIEPITSEQSIYIGGIILSKKLNYTEQSHFGFVLKATVSSS